MQIGELREGEAEIRPVGLPSQPVARPPRLVEGVRPVAVELQHLRAAHQAGAAERHHVRVRVAPPGERAGPLLRARPVERVVAGADDAAVDDAGHEGADFARRHAEHRFVEEREALRRTALADQSATDGLAGERGDVRIAAGGADRRGAFEVRLRAVGIAGLHHLQAGRAQQEALFGARRRAAGRRVEQASGAGHPRAGLRLLAAPLEQREGHPEGASCRATRLAAVEEGLVRARPRAGPLGLASDEHRRRGEPVEILGLERRLTVGLRQPRVRLRPRLPRERRTPFGEARVHGVMIPHSARKFERGPGTLRTSYNAHTRP
ncbi:MAG: hypothetical protein R2752_14300 [Vicinamibacterales bacterium]